MSFYESKGESKDEYVSKRLGNYFGLTAEETNVLLEEDGFLTGEPRRRKYPVWIWGRRLSGLERLTKRRLNMKREEVKAQVDELMRQYADEEIDGDTYAQKMMELTITVQSEINEE